MNNVHLIDHPLLQHSLTRIRDASTSAVEFRRHAAIVAQIMVVEATRNLKMHQEKVITPLGTAAGYIIDQQIVLVPVLRAGISMLFPAKELLPWVPVGFIGLERDERTAIAREYYQKFPAHLPEKLVMILDPMLATGGSLNDTITSLKKKGALNICVICVVAAPEGIGFLQKKHPEVSIYTAAIDSHLNDDRFIIPGLGDFGDRYFGT
ncbi:MAG: uracil phosphoribosyltransferase [Candidatus Cloacimonetes bacterium]|nr:uracil phosphoribosyltransferase [Candidatus Cloacimonadota bacterium]